MSRHLESKLQEACYRWFSYSYPEYKGLLFAVPNGGYRDIRTAQTLKKEGVVAGVSDLILFVPRGKHHALCIEMKVKGNYPTELQKEWAQKVTLQGYRYEVVYDFEKFTTLIDSYLKENN